MYDHVEVERDTNGTLMVSFPDFPAVTTFAETEEDVPRRALDALETAVDYLIRQRLPIPEANPKRAGVAVILPALVSAKIALHNEMLAQGVTRAALSRRLQVHRPQVDRLLDTRHNSRFDEIERAFGTLGRHLEVTVGEERVPAGVVQTQRHAASRRRMAARKR